MKFQVYNPQQAAAKPYVAPKPKLIEGWQFQFIRNADCATPGMVRTADPEALILRAVDKYGAYIPDSNILKMKTDGTVYLYDTVNPGLGLPLDVNGRVVVSKD